MTETKPLEKTAYHAYLNKFGTRKEIAAEIHRAVTQENNPQAWKLLEATGDTAYTSETFDKAAELIKNLYK